MEEKCVLCGKEADECCPDGVCRACHKSLTFEDCCDGTWAVGQLLKNGHLAGELKKLYPNAMVKV